MPRSIRACGSGEAMSRAGSPVARRIAWPLAGLGLIVLLALLAPWIAPYDPVKMDLPRRLSLPSAGHWLGQDEFGRDVVSRLVWGARASLAVAIMSALIAGVIGTTLGLLGGYFRGFVEVMTVRLADVVLSFPPILLALLIVTLAGPGEKTLIAVLSLLYAPGFTRVAYGEVLSARELEYVEAARAAGAGPFRILARTVLPNVLPPLLVQLSLTVAAAIVIESGLSFLGLGGVPPQPSWGLMIRGARATMEQNWLLLLWPCLALVVTILLVNRLCDALRDAFDPRVGALMPAASLGQALAGPLAPRPEGDPPAPNPREPLIQVVDLETRFETPAGPIRPVDGVTFTIRRGETVALVGESGSGKSLTGLSIIGLVPRPAGRISRGAVHFTGRDGVSRDLVRLSGQELESVRGNEIAMIFQEPMTSLNPVYRVGDQIEEAVRRHRRVGASEARVVAVAMLARVGIPDPLRRADDFPHQLSGGMRQRAMMAMALACEPKLLIADEPTTALDVTIQAQILDLLRRLRADPTQPLGMLFITHNFGVVAEIADRVLVMYAGKIVEEADVRDIFRAPRHPYTKGLLASMPRPGASERPSAEREPLASIPGQVPSLASLPAGCAFAPRCMLADDRCRAEAPILAAIAPGHRSRCHRWREL